MPRVRAQGQPPLPATTQHNEAPAQRNDWQAEHRRDHRANVAGLPKEEKHRTSRGAHHHSAGKRPAPAHARCAQRQHRQPREANNHPEQNGGAVDGLDPEHFHERQNEDAEVLCAARDADKVFGPGVPPRIVAPQCTREDLAELAYAEHKGRMVNAMRERPEYNFARREHGGDLTRNQHESK